MLILKSKLLSFLVPSRTPSKLRLCTRPALVSEEMPNKFRGGRHFTIRKKNNMKNYQPRYRKRSESLTSLCSLSPFCLGFGKDNVKDRRGREREKTRE